MKYFVRTGLILILAVICFAGSALPLFAYVMSSGNYQIQSDSTLSPAGGLGTSANYVFQDTMGQVSSGASNSALYKIKAGFQEMQDVSLSVTAPADTALSPDIPGVSGGTANADTHWIVQTDNNAGFDMKINSSTNPAMKLVSDPLAVSFDDYAVTPAVWNVGAGLAKFGFTVAPADANDAVTAFKDDGNGNCGTGVNTGHCWSGLATTKTPIIHRVSRTDANGQNELISFRAQSNKLLQAGNYSAQITITVVAN